MGFSPNIKYRAFLRAGGRCECTRENCGHQSRCTKTCALSTSESFLAGLTGDASRYSYPGFEFHHRVAQSSGGDDTLSNCEFLCEDCHKNTGSYGR